MANAALIAARTLATEAMAKTKMHHATRAKAERLATMLAAEYPALVLSPHGVAIDHETYDAELTDWSVIFYGEDDHSLMVGSSSTHKLPELADILETCESEDCDPTDDGEDEAPAHSGSIVRDAYRQQYILASSNGQTCGDWLAEQLVADTTGSDGKLVMDDLIAVYEANGVDLTAKWAMARFVGSRGWQGRFRMSGRLVLEKIVLLAGEYRDQQGNRHEPSAEFLADMAAKHAKWLAKEHKRRDAAEAAIREAVEG